MVQDLSMLSFSVINSCFYGSKCSSLKMCKLIFCKLNSLLKPFYFIYFPDVIEAFLIGVKCNKSTISVVYSSGGHKLDTATVTL